MTYLVVTRSGAINVVLTVAPLGADLTGVADRILNFARVVGRENVIAGTDCGLGGRIHPQLVWAKLAALVEGAKLASKELYGS